MSDDNDQYANNQNKEFSDMTREELLVAVRTIPPSTGYLEIVTAISDDAFAKLFSDAHDEPIEVGYALASAYYDKDPDKAVDFLSGPST